MARGLNVSCVMTCLLRKQKGQGTLNLYLTWTGQSIRKTLSNRCIECGKTNANKVEIDKHIYFPLGKTTYL